MNKKITIFLDIDGVLYTSKNYNKLLANNLATNDDYGYLFDDKCVENLSKLNKHIHFDVIITSSWRTKGIDYLETLFRERNININIVGITPIGTMDKLYFSRCEEVKDYIKTNNITTDIIIIDDNFGECNEKYDVYKTTMKNGLTEDITNKIINKYE